MLLAAKGRKKPVEFIIGKEYAISKYIYLYVWYKLKVIPNVRQLDRGKMMFQGMEYVYEIYKEKSFSKAAKKLFVSQPSLSATVKRIEKKVGYPLFDRSKKPLELTECGERYIKTVEQIMAAKNDFINYVNDWGELKSGKLTIGGGSLFLSYVLPSYIREFARNYPGIQIEILEESSGKLEEYLQSGNIDMVLDNSHPDTEIYDMLPIKEEHLLLAVPKNFVINERLKEYQLSAEDIRNGEHLKEDAKEVSLSEFKEEPFILLKHDNDTRERAVQICQEHKFKPNVVFELDQQVTSYNITSSGMGISFISDTLIAMTPSNSAIVCYKLKGVNTQRDIYLYWKKGRYISRAMAEFMKIINQKREK